MSSTPFCASVRVRVEVVVGGFGNGIEQSDIRVVASGSNKGRITSMIGSIEERIIDTTRGFAEMVEPRGHPFGLPVRIRQQRRGSRFLQREEEWTW